jgi:DsbC/DsbD-like thiol-disulfide interchange protein
MTQRTRLQVFFAGVVLLSGSAGFGLYASGTAVSLAQTSASNAGAAVVKTQSYISVDQVEQGSAFEAAVVVAIQKGYHVNAHKTSDEFLIPTTLTAQLPAGLKQVETVYPEGHLQKLAFSEKPINVYDGSVTLKMRLQTTAAAAPGETSIPFVLRYQACNDTTCLPPVKVPVELKLKIAPAGTKAHPTHPEIFTSRNPSPAH